MRSLTAVVHSCCGAGDPDSKISNTRAKHWLTNSDTCSGKWLREVCNVGWGDLPWIVASPEMFINKIRLEESPLAFRCLEQWYRDRVDARHLASVSERTSPSAWSLADLGYRFNLTYYSQQSFVQQRHMISTATPLTLMSRTTPLSNTLRPHRRTNTTQGRYHRGRTRRQ